MVQGDDAKTVKNEGKWFRELHGDRIYIRDDNRNSRPSTSATCGRITSERTDFRRTINQYSKIQPRHWGCQLELYTTLFVLKCFQIKEPELLKNLRFKLVQKVEELHPISREYVS